MRSYAALWGIGTSSEFIYIGHMLKENGTDDKRCSRKVMCVVVRWLAQLNFLVNERSKKSWMVYDSTWENAVVCAVMWKMVV